MSATAPTEIPHPAPLLLAGRLVRKYAPRLRPETADFDDALGCCLLGLSEAVGTYDPAAGHAFATHGAWRAREQLRRYLMRRRRRGFRAPPEGVVPLASLDVEAGGRAESLTRADLVTDRRQPDIDALLDVPVLLPVLLADLPDRCRRVLAGLYLAGRTAPEVAAELGVSEFAIYKTERRALTHLRERCAEAGLDPPTGFRVGRRRR